MKNCFVVRTRALADMFQSILGDDWDVYTIDQALMGHCWKSIVVAVSVPSNGTEGMKERYHHAIEHFRTHLEIGGRMVFI